MLQPNRHGSIDSYRYGFQGQEKDDEIKGEGNSINYKYRMHDPRVGRFFAVDPLTGKYPWYSPYQFAGNKVIQFVELEGLEEFRKRTKTDWLARFFKVRPGDNLTVISEVAGVAVNDIIKFNPTIQDDPNHIEAGQILMLRDMSGLTVGDFTSDVKTSNWVKEFVVELATTNENGPSIQSQVEAVLIAEGAGSLPSLARGLRNLPRMLRKKPKVNTKPKADPDLPVEQGSRRIAVIDDAAENFIRKSGVDDVQGHIDAIYPGTASVETLPAGTKLYRFSTKGTNSPKHYFTTNKNALPGDVGKNSLRNNPSEVIFEEYTLTKPVEVLKSRVNLINEPGATQVFSTQIQGSSTYRTLKDFANYRVKN